MLEVINIQGMSSKLEVDKNVQLNPFIREMKSRHTKN